MQKVVIGIIMFVLAVVLIVGVLVPIATHGKSSGQGAKTRMTNVDNSANTLASPIN